MTKIDPQADPEGFVAWRTGGAAPRRSAAKTPAPKAPAAEDGPRDPWREPGLARMGDLMGQGTRLPREIRSRLSAAGLERRMRIGEETGFVFGDDRPFDGFTLRIEASGILDGLRLAGLMREATSPLIRAVLELRPSEERATIDALRRLTSGAGLALEDLAALRRLADAAAREVGA